ncbi:hypothetical protein [Kistimonas scapharcae]
MKDLPVLAGPSSVPKRKLSYEGTSHGVKKTCDIKSRVELRQGTYIGDMKSVWVVSLPRSDRERYVPSSVLDSYGATLKTGILPVFYRKKSACHSELESGRYIEILDRIEVCFRQRNIKKEGATTAKPKEDVGASIGAEKEGEVFTPLLKRINDNSEFLIDVKEHAEESSVEVFLCGFLDTPKGLRQKFTAAVLPSDAAMGKIIAVFFSSPAVDQWLSDNGGENRKKCDMQMEFKLPKGVRNRNISIDNKWIKYGEGVVYQREEMAWRLLYHYQNKNIKINLQTLVYQDPLIEDEHAEIITISNGERFLSEQLIKKVYQHQCDTDKSVGTAAAGPVEPLVWTWCTKDSLTDFLQENVNIQQKDFFYNLDSHMHTVAVFMYKHKGYLACYIHETLGVKNSVAIQIRTDVENIVKAFYADTLIYIMYPSLKLQYDYESCGVIALKAMDVMRKKTEGLMNDLNAVIGKPKAGQKQKARIVHLQVKVNHLKSRLTLGM